MEWTWDERKAEANRRQHGVSFKLAARALADPLVAYEPDPHPNGDRWRTIGMGGGLLLVVIHTWPDEGRGRIISARKAERHERRSYERLR